MRSSTRSLKVVAAVDQLHGYAFVVLAPEIGRTLHLSSNGLVTIGMARGAGFVLVGATVGALARNGNARRVARVGAAARAGALLVGVAAAIPTVGGGLGAYGAAAASVPSAHAGLMAPDERESHRVVARLGNAGAPLVIGALALLVAWPTVFATLAVVAGIAALTTIALRDAPAGGFATDATDELARHFIAIPGTRVTLALIVAGGIVELPMHVALFAHLGTDLHVPVMGRALLAGGAEFAGVVANLALGRRLQTARTRSVQSLAVGLVATLVVGLVALIVAVAASSIGTALIALAIGSIAVSASIPVLTLGTRAVLAGAVPRTPPIAVAGVVAAFVLVATPTAAVTVATIAALLLVGGLATARLAVREPAALADVLGGLVANVTSAERMPAAPPALKRA